MCKSSPMCRYVIRLLAYRSFSATAIFSGVTASVAQPVRGSTFRPNSPRSNCLYYWKIVIRYEQFSPIANDLSSNSRRHVYIYLSMLLTWTVLWANPAPPPPLPPCYLVFHGFYNATRVILFRPLDVSHCKTSIATYVCNLKFTI